MKKRIVDKIGQAYDKIENIDKKWELITVVGISLLLVFGVTIGMGTLTSGFHMVDDHEFSEWVYQMKYQGMSVLDIMKTHLTVDFWCRYRPLYYPTRILRGCLFGTNLTLHAILKAIETVLSFVFLYYSGRHMGGSKVYSYLAALIALVGYQSVAWWKLGPQESLGTLLFCAGFYCMILWLENSQKKNMAVVSMILYFLMANYKESYVVLIPFIMLYVVYYDIKREELGINWSTIGNCIKRRIWYLLALAVCFMIPVVIIIKFVGLHNYGKVGLDANAPLQEYIDGITMSFQKDLKWFLRFGILFCAILLTYWDELKKLWKEMLLAVVLVLPQFILYGKAGIVERYILPASIGFAYFFVLVILDWKPLSGKRRVVYIVGVLLLLAAHGRAALREADYYRYRGESTTKMLNSVYDMTTEGNVNVLACFRPNEEGNRTINYDMKLRGFDNVYYWDEESGTITKNGGVLFLGTEDHYEEQSFADMDIVVMYNREDRHWCYEPSLNLSDFTELPCGTLTIYVRNDSVKNIVKPQVAGLKINF